LFLLLVSVLPIFITRHIIYGNAFESGYGSVSSWMWSSPAFLKVLFSSNHGLLVWTPVLFFSFLRLLLFFPPLPPVGGIFLAAFVAFYVFIASYPDWAGISSYGNRFFVSLTALFILGLAVFLERFSQLFRSSKAAFATAASALVLLVLWNFGLMIQW